MCEVPMLVMTAISGCAAAVMREISPKWFMPISATMTSVSRVMRKSVSGRPISLFKLPSVFRALNFCFKTAYSSSLVVVLPTEPVTPTTLPPHSSR